MADASKRMVPVAGPRLLRVFLCHSSHDKPQARQLYESLRAAGCKPWLDEKDIPGGATWENAIEDAVKAADVVIACISGGSVNAEGYLQRELRLALGVAEEKPDDTIFIIPLLLEDCELPRKLASIQAINYSAENGFERLLEALGIRAQQLGAVIPKLPSQPDPIVPAVHGTYERASEAAEFIKSRSQLRPGIALVLGGGLGRFADRLTDSFAADFDEIPYFPIPPGRAAFGRIVVGRLGTVPIAAMVGRLHAYEGLRLDEVVFPMRLFGLMGIPRVIFTSAVGSVNEQFDPGTAVVISDHINQLGSEPFSGPNDERFGPRFPDMSRVYSKHLRSLAAEAAAEVGIKLAEAVFLIRRGPAYETPAEARAMRNMGADVVGMSTVAEAMTAAQMGMEVLAFAMVTNWLAGIGSATPPDHEQVLASASRVARDLHALLSVVIPKIVAEFPDRG